MSFKGVLDLRGALLQPLKSRQHTLRQLFRNEKAIQTTILIESARHWSKDKSDKVNYFQLLNLILTGLIVVSSSPMLGLLLEPNLA